jgi:hypothetical protein
MDLFQDIASHSHNPALYTAAARGLFSHARWKEVSDVYRLALASRALSEEISLVAIQALEKIDPPKKTRLMRSIAEEAAATVGMEPLAWVERQYYRLRTQISFYSLRRLLWWDDPSTAFLDELELVVGQWRARKSTVAIEESASAPHTAAARIMLNAAKHFHEEIIPPDKVAIPHVPRSVSAWKSLVDEIVDEFDLTIWQSKPGPRLAADVIHAYRNLLSDHDCLSFTFYCLENDIELDRRALRDAIGAAQDINDENSARTLQMIAQGNEDSALTVN